MKKQVFGEHHALYKNNICANWDSHKQYKLGNEYEEGDDTSDFHKEPDCFYQALDSR